MIARAEAPLEVDVAVVGAGPAGSAAACRLAEAGLSVALIDRTTFPRSKPCGDGLSPRAVRHLREFVDPDTSTGFVPIRSVGFVRHFPDRTSKITFEKKPGEPNSAFVVERMLLDTQLYNAAVSRGAIPMLETSFRDLKSDGDRHSLTLTRGDRTFTLRASFVIGADGSRSVVARKTGMNTSLAAAGVAVRWYARTPDIRADEIELYLPYTMPGQTRPIPGYAWVFPGCGGISNVGIGVYGGRFDTTRMRELAALFGQQLAEHHPAFAHAPPIERFAAGVLPISTPNRRAQNGVFLVGDAAGVVHPVTGEGIGHALETGLLAADAILEAALDGDVADERYEAALEQTYGPMFDLQRSVIKYPYVYELAGRLFAGDGGIASEVRRRFLHRGEAQDRSSVPAPAARLTDSVLDTLACHRDRARQVFDRLLESIGDVVPMTSLLSDFLLNDLVAIQLAAVHAGKTAGSRDAIAALLAFRLSMVLESRVARDSSLRDRTADPTLEDAAVEATFAMMLSDGLLVEGARRLVGLDLRQSLIVQQAHHRSASNAMRAARLARKRPVPYRGALAVVAPWYDAAVMLDHTSTNPVSEAGSRVSAGLLAAHPVVKWLADASRLDRSQSLPDAGLDEFVSGSLPCSHTLNWSRDKLSRASDNPFAGVLHAACTVSLEPRIDRQIYELNEPFQHGLGGVHTAIVTVRKRAAAAITDHRA